MKDSNRGQTNLKIKRRTEDPMRAYDALPAQVRHWLSQAAMPWSPASCRRILRNAKARGEDMEQVLARLDHAERQTLSKRQTSQF